MISREALLFFHTFLMRDATEKKGYETMSP